MIVYEFPFNESMRTLLRLEHLLGRLGELLVRESAIDHHHALATLFEVMDVASRADIKSDLLQELDRQRQQLTGYRGNPAISEATLEAVIARVDVAHLALLQQPGKAGHALTGNEWLMSIRSRISIPGGTCEFDLPAYYAWQHLSAERRRADLQRWVGTLAPLAAALQLTMELLRGTGLGQTVALRAGQFQQRLPHGRGYQLARVKVNADSGWVPEISGNRLQVTIRLMQLDAEGRLRPLNEDAELDLTLCA